jgi:hypothetical protein
MSLWHASDPDSPISLQTPLSYADRLRIRQPGDAQFALGPHQDGGSVERWEKEGYGRGGVYDAIFRGEWERCDPFDASGRVHAVTDLYGGLGSCSMFRMWQGWLSISNVGPGEGTLLVNPLSRESTAYTLLRPFFRPVKSPKEVGQEKYLGADNWEFTAGESMTSDLQGATPGHGQEFPEGLHPHLELEKTMVHVPKVKPGDYVVWHCDSTFTDPPFHVTHGPSRCGTKCGPCKTKAKHADISKQFTQLTRHTTACQTRVSCIFPFARLPRPVRSTLRTSENPSSREHRVPTSPVDRVSRNMSVDQRQSTSRAMGIPSAFSLWVSTLSSSQTAIRAAASTQSNRPTSCWGFEARK